ncbi:MAG: cupin domain-containing protein [Deltaproteobacteria bacterium]|nr:cupin domain-containing protein [Deltaproteobacteria bacterium]
MIHRKAVILRAADIARHELPWVQRLNPRSQFSGSPLSRIAGFERVGVSRGRIPPGGEAFAYHAHEREEEWIYIVDGRARLRVDGEEIELAAGDFAAFPAPQAPHLLANPYSAECVYLMGGERTASPDVLEYPELGKRYVLLREPTRTAFHELGPAEYPFGRANAKPPQPWRVLATKGCGSAIAEAVLALAELPYEREEVNYEEPAGRARLLEHNPLAQVPTVIAPDGAVMTESAAIALHVDELVPGVGLLPAVGDPLRREALRHLVFIVAAIYPTFTYGDNVARWGGGEPLRAATNAHREALWKHMESVARGPWFLGARWSVLDLYVAVMTNWRPNPPWFREMTPKLAAIAAAVEKDPRLAHVWAANFA